MRAVKTAVTSAWFACDYASHVAFNRTQYIQMTMAPFTPSVRVNTESILQWHLWYSSYWNQWSDSIDFNESYVASAIAMLTLLWRWRLVQMGSMTVLLTVLQCCMSPWSTLRPSMTMRPAIMAFVVAIAGMMLPAIAEKFSWALNYWQTYTVLDIMLPRYDTLVINSIACMYSHLTSKRDFNGIPKIWALILDAHVTKSIAAESSWILKKLFNHLPTPYEVPKAKSTATRLD